MLILYMFHVRPTCVARSDKWFGWVVGGA